MGYRSRASYISKDPVRRARQISGLTSSKNRKQPPIATDLRYKFKGSIIEFAELHFYIPETRQPIVLLDYEKEFLFDLFHKKVKPTLALLGTPKKCGKSTLAAIVALWTLVKKEESETYIVGPDIEQSQLVVYNKIRKAIRMNAYLQKFLNVKKEQITNRKNGSFVRPLACSSTNAGLNPTLNIFDELWRFNTDEAKATYDELTNIPSEDNLNLIVTYAGFAEDEDSILWRLYKAGIDQQEGKIERDERFLFRWYNEKLYEQIPWVTSNYLTLQHKRLRQNTYKRLHRNEWVSGSENFVDAAVLDACVHPNYRKGLPFSGKVAVGVDIGLKHDTSAIVLVGGLDKDTLAVVDHSCFVPKEHQTLDLEKTVEAALLAYNKKYSLKAVYYDPYQFARSAKTLQKKGLPMVEYPQTTGNTVAMSETLSGLLNNQTLMLYEDSQFRGHLLNAQAKETQRGWRLVKKRQSRKIDLAVSLAIASQAAQDNFLLRNTQPGKVYVGGLSRTEFNDIGYGIRKRTPENAGKGLVHII